MNPRALLVNPWIHDFAAHDLWSRPLGLLELGSWLRAGGWDVSLIDCLDIHYPGRTASLPERKANGTGPFDYEFILKPKPLAHVPRRFKRYGMPTKIFHSLLTKAGKPDAVFVSSVMTYWYTGVAETIAAIKNAFPDTPVILGGVYATLMPEHAAEYTGADHVIEGDFRDCLPTMLSPLGLPAGPADLDAFPAWDLYGKIEGGAIITGRGCSHRCPYCAVHAMRPQLTRRDPKAVVEEIERMVRDFGIHDVAFFDDALRAGGDGHLTSILEGVIRKKIDARLHAINALHLRDLSPELCRLLVRCNFKTLRFGLETADPVRNEALGKKADLENLRQAVRHLKGMGMESRDIGAYMLAGLPGQPPGEIESGIEAVIAAGARPILTEYSPVPKSPMWETAVAASPFDISSEPLLHNNTILSCAHPALDFKTLETLKRRTREPFKRSE